VIGNIARAGSRVPRWAAAVADQGLVAVVNLSLSVTVTQVSGVAVLGRFAVIATTILVCLGLARLLVSDPWLASRTVDRESSAELRWLIVLCAAATAVVVAVVAWVTSGGDARWLLACPIAAVVIVQDFGRYVAFRVEAPARALASDASVLLVGAASFAVCAVTGQAGLTAILLSWLAGLVAGVIVAWQRLRGRLTWAGSAGWWRRYCRPLATKLAFDSLAYLVGVSGSLYLLAYLATERDVGVVRIVQTMFSPAALTVTGLTMWLVPFLSNRDPQHTARVRRRVTVWLAAAALPMIVAAVALGPWAARLVFGVTDPPGSTALALAGVSTLGMAVTAPWVASARVSGRYLPIAWTRAGAAIITITGMWSVVALRSTTGYLGLLALQNVMVAATSIVIGMRASRAPDASSAR
jgi:hypothetical protein